MASANVELVRSIFTAWERGDFSSVEWAHPEIEYVLVDVPDARGSWTGPAGMAEGWRDFLGAWEEFRAEVDEYRELDGERVLVLVHWTGARRADWSSGRCGRGQRPFSTSATAR
jgi:ketosteroid isomerase-like protein